MFTLNRGNGISHRFNTQCSKEAVAERHAMVLTVKNNIFANNTDTAFYFQSNCRFNVTLNHNRIKHCGLRAVDLVYGYASDNSLQNVYMYSNTIEGNQYGVRVQGVSAVILSIANNLFQNNLNTVLFIDTHRHEVHERSIKLSVFGNTFMNNHMKEGSVIKIRAEYRGSHGQTGNYTLNNNILKDNVVHKQPDNYLYSLQDLSAVIYLNVNTFVDLRYNVFDNPSSHWEVTTGDHTPENIIDARFCFWGTKEIDRIGDKIFAYDYSYLLSIVLFVPYLNSENLSDSSQQLPGKYPF